MRGEDGSEDGLGFGGSGEGLGLLVEAIEDWALAVSRLLTLSRRESGMERLNQSLEGSLRRAAIYLRALAAIVGPDGTTVVPADQQIYRDQRA